MNFAGVVILMVVAAGAIFGLFYIASHSSTTAITDTYGEMSSIQTNLSRDNATNLSAVGINTGGAGVPLLVMAMSVVFLGFFIMGAMKYGRTYYGRGK